MTEYTFGEIKGIKEGDLFKNRKELREKGIQLQTVWGIDGNGNVGCPAIALNGGFVDDEDLGDVIIYTGHGGNKGKKQIADQSWEDRGNKALIVSALHGLPIRVSRGHKHRTPFSPKSGYQYCGLYSVTDFFEERGKHGFKICRYRLEKIKKEIIQTKFSNELTKGNKNILRTEVSTLRIIRDTKLSKEIKELYDYVCQVCGIIIEIKGVRYAEAAHIKPLGKPHNGEDTPENLICLCPNHHVMFDKGIWGIKNDLSLYGLDGKLLLNKKHKLDNSNLEYHIKHIMI